LTVLLMLPLPLAGHVPPPAPAHVQVAVREAGNVSATVAPVTLLGPALLATIVYVTLPPGGAVVTPSVFVIERSAFPASVSVSVAELFAGTGSVTPPGTATVAVFTRLPVADALIVALTVYVTLPPAGRLTVLLMLPFPLAGQVPPPAPAHVHVAVKDAGNVSATVAPVTLLGPALLAVIVYVTLPPGVAVVTPSVFVIERSAFPTSVSVSVAELFPGVGSVTPPGTATVAVFTRLPVAAALIVALTVYVTLPPTGRLTVLLMLPLPLAGHVPPPAPAHVHVAVKDAGNVSATVAPVTLLGPALLATIV
jgi:hypothetical protein